MADLSREEPARAAEPTRQRTCLFCYSPISNGSPVCSEACDEAWWQLVPTLDGELFEPPQRPPAGRQQATRDQRGWIMPPGRERALAGPLCEERGQS